MATRKTSKAAKGTAARKETLDADVKRSPNRSSLRAEAAGKAKALARKEVVTGGRPRFLRVAKPDAIDFRDRPFHPTISVTPREALYPARSLPVKNQESTNACTGFGLALVAEHLLRESGREKSAAVSPYMLYSMARRYD